MGKQAGARRELLHIELIRVVACYLVIYNHSPAFSVYKTTASPFFSNLFLSVSIFDKIAVPLFFMISGALLLGKEEPLPVVYKKRIMGIVRPLVISTVLYYIFNYSQGSYKTISVIDFLYRFFYDADTLAGQLWYLFSYLGFLILIPFLRKMVKSMDDKCYFYLIFCNLLFKAIIPWSVYMITGGGFYKNWSVHSSMLVTWSMICPVMGYWIEHIIGDIYKTKQALMLWAASILIGIGLTVVIYRFQESCTGSTEYTFFDGFSVPIACGTYLFIKCLCRNSNGQSKRWKIIKTIGGCTFGMYLLDLFMTQETKFIRNYILDKLSTIPFTASLLYCLVKFIITFMIVFGFKKLKSSFLNIMKKYRNSNE